MISRSENKYMATNAYQVSNTKTEISSVAGQIEVKWTVEGDLFDAFLNAGTGEGFESNEFVFSDGIWKLKCYPNGTKKYGQGNVSLFLAVMKLPSGVVQMGVQYEFECKEVNYKDEYGSELTNIFNKKHSSWGYPETFKRNLLINLQKKKLCKITIKCCMKKVLLVSIVTIASIDSSGTSMSMNSSSSFSYGSDGEIISDKEKINKTSHNVTWFIDPLMINGSITTDNNNSINTDTIGNKQSFDSTSFQLHRTKWCLQCFPNGDKYANTGMVSLYLKLLEFPDNNAYFIRNMKVRMQFECTDIQYQSNEFFHTYENKKQEVYFGISSAFKKNNLFASKYINHNSNNMSNCNNCITITCRIDLISVSIDGEKWWHCIRERDSLKAKAKRIEYEAKEQNKKLQTSYVCNKVIKIDKQQINKQRDKIKKINDESNYILKEHFKILKQWNILTESLNKIINNDYKIDINNTYSNDNINNINNINNNENNDDNDIKEDNKNKNKNNKESDGYNLLNEYVKFRYIIDEQQNRLEMVSSNVSILLLKQTTFLSSIEQWKQDQIKNKNEYISLLKKYNDIKNERMELQKDITEKVNDCNNKIDEENMLNKKKCNKDNELNAMSLELKVFGNMSKECNNLIEKYNEFFKINNENIIKLNKFILLKWNNFEKNWIEWNTKDIMVFIKYKMNWFDISIKISNIDLNKIQLNMLQKQINGISLIEFSKNDLYSIGFTNYQIRCQIFNHIQTLRTKYPPPKINIHANISSKTIMHPNGTRKEERIRSHSNASDNSINSNNSNNIIPSKFICPITKNLMNQPVMAFDGYTYEKYAIEEYLKKYGKSPKTKKDAHTLYTFPNLQLQQEIETFRAVNEYYKDGDGNETYNIE